MDSIMSIFIFVIVFVLIANIAICVWVYRDAKQRRLNAWLWVVLVIVTGNFGGLILYLLVGRSQINVICDNCNSTVSSKGSFCSVCGEKIQIKERDIIETKYNKGWLIVCISCICIALASILLFVFAYFNISGFQFERQYSFRQINYNKYVNDLTQKSSGDSWKLSFEDSSEGFTFSKRYIAEEKPLELIIESLCSNNGKVKLFITQGETRMEEIVSTGRFSFDLSTFEQGKMLVEVININAVDFEGEIRIVEDK